MSLPWLEGGVVSLGEWELGELARAAFPALSEGGLGGRWIALREKVGWTEQALGAVKFDPLLPDSG